VKPKNLAVILEPTTNIWQKKSNKTEFGSFELNFKNWWYIYFGMQMYCLNLTLDNMTLKQQN
jgi:hypothetical protein